MKYQILKRNPRWVRRAYWDTNSPRQNSDWKLHKSYDTEKAANEAFEVLKKRHFNEELNHWYPYQFKLIEK